MLEGTKAAPGIFVTAASTTAAAGKRSDTSGSFKIGAIGFTAPDCYVVVSDGRTAAVAGRRGRHPRRHERSELQGQTAGNIIGTPTLEGTDTFTLQATDGTGATDTETFTITVTR